MQVLLAVADRDLREMLAFAVGFAGHHARYADLARVGDVVDAVHPDLLVLALAPGETEAMAQALRCHTQVPILALAGADSPWLTAAVPCSDVAVLPLPVRPRDLRERLAELRARQPALLIP